jgi:hypothetical protein
MTASEWLVILCRNWILRPQHQRAACSSGMHTRQVQAPHLGWRSGHRCKGVEAGSYPLPAGIDQDLIDHCQPRIRLLVVADAGVAKWQCLTQRTSVISCSSQYSDHE